MVTFEWNPIARTTEYTNQSNSEPTAFELEVSNFVHLLISDRAQNLGVAIIFWEELCGEFWIKSNGYNYKYTIHSNSEQTAFEIEVSNFVQLLISDRAQNLGIIIIWWEESFGVFWVKSNRQNQGTHQPLL